VCSSDLSANIGAYADIIAERAKLRKLIRVAYEIAESGYSPGGQKADDVLDVAEQKVFQIADDRPKDGGPQAINPLLQAAVNRIRSEEHTSELQSRENLVCRLLLDTKDS